MKPIEINMNKNDLFTDSIKLKTDLMIKLIVDCCETDLLLKLIKDRLMENVKSYPKAKGHLDDLKAFLNAMK